MDDVFCSVIQSRFRACQEGNIDDISLLWRRKSDKTPKYKLSFKHQRGIIKLKLLRLRMVDTDNTYTATHLKHFGRIYWICKMCKTLITLLLKELLGWFLSQNDWTNLRDVFSNQTFIDSSTEKEFRVVTRFLKIFTLRNPRVIFQTVKVALYYNSLVFRIPVQ